MSVINDLVSQIEDVVLRERIANEVDRLSKQKKFGLVFEEHLPECTPLYDIPVKVGALVAKKNEKVNDVYRVMKINGNLAECLRRESKETSQISLNELVSVAEFGDPIYPYLKPLDSVCNAPDSDLWHTLIEADNYHALQLLEYLYAGKVDCIYIDPPYNTGAKDWKYNNDYVDGNDTYRHSKWLSMMQKRLKIAKKLLNPKDSVLIVTIDEKEYLHLGCLLEEMFPEARMQMISSVINTAGSTRDLSFARTDEYLFIFNFGESKPQPLMLSREWLIGKNTNQGKITWDSLKRAGGGNGRKDSPGCFYPVFVNQEGTRIIEIGNAVPNGVSRKDIVAPNGTIAIWPIRDDGSEGRWQQNPEHLRFLLEKGFVKLGRFTGAETMAISYLKNGEQQKVDNGIYIVTGHREDGSIIVNSEIEDAKFLPGTQWNINAHNAKQHGSILLSRFLGKQVFSYPKSLYAVHDAIRFFVASKPNALIVDFFAGSGTTLHAVNLLNAEDGGHRRCIMVTNNEVSEAEAKELTKAGYHPGDAEWEKLGIAQYVTWPRTVCSIEGHNINGEPLKGNYIGGDIPMADGFKANAAFFKLSFLDKNAVALGMQFKELLPILWMKAGAIGKCPEFSNTSIPKMIILPQNKLAVLIDEKAYMDFIAEMDKQPEIKTIYFVTDSEAGYRDMISGMEDKNTYQLYRDYLDNFRINTARR